MQFAEKLHSLRDRAGLTQARLAELSGVSLRTIQGWEQGYRCPVSPDFFKLVKALGVSADVFADLEGADETSQGKPRGRPRKASLPAGEPRATGKKPSPSRKQ